MIIVKFIYQIYPYWGGVGRFFPTPTTRIVVDITTNLDIQIEFMQEI